MRNAAGMRWRRPSRNPRHRQIEAAPDQLHRTAFAAEARTKFFENAICLEEDAPEAVSIVQIISGVFLILIEGNRFQCFIRLHSNLDFKREFSEVVDYGTIKVRDTLRLQRNHTLIACRCDNT